MQVSSLVCKSTLNIHLLLLLFMPLFASSYWYLCWTLACCSFLFLSYFVVKCLMGAEVSRFFCILPLDNYWFTFLFFLVCIYFVFLSILRLLTMFWVHMLMQYLLIDSKYPYFTNRPIFDVCAVMFKKFWNSHNVLPPQMCFM